MSSISGISSTIGRAGFDPAQMAQSILTKLTEDFGAEAAAQVVNSDGTLNHRAIKNLLASKGIQPGGGRMEKFGPAGGLGIDPAKLLEKFSADFGEETAKEIQNEDGSINFERLKEIIQEYRAAEGTYPARMPDPSGSLFNVIA